MKFNLNGKIRRLSREKQSVLPGTANLTGLLHTLLPHLGQGQVRVQVGEAVQHHRAAVLHHLQLHPVPNAPNLPRRVEHFEQLSRLKAARLGFNPREKDHGGLAGGRWVTAVGQASLTGFI